MKKLAWIRSRRGREMKGKNIKILDSLEITISNLISLNLAKNKIRQAFGSTRLIIPLKFLLI